MSWWNPYSAAPLLIVIDVDDASARARGATDHAVRQLIRGDYSTRYRWTAFDIRITVFSSTSAYPAAPAMEWNGRVPFDLPEQLVNSTDLRDTRVSGLVVPATAAHAGLTPKWGALFRGPNAIADFVLRRDQFTRLFELRDTAPATYATEVEIGLQQRMVGIELPNNRLLWELTARRDHTRAVEEARGAGLDGDSWGEIRESRRFLRAMEHSPRVSALVCKGWEGLLYLQLACRLRHERPARVCMTSGCSERAAGPRAAHCAYHTAEREREGNRQRKQESRTKARSNRL